VTEADALRAIIYQSASDCTQSDCQHCRILGRLMGKLTGELLLEAGPGHMGCALHGVQGWLHECDWTRTQPHILVTVADN